MYGRGYYGNPYSHYPYAHPYAHSYAMLGQDPNVPPDGPLAAPPPPMPPMQMQDLPATKIKIEPARLKLSTGGFFQVALAVTTGLVFFDVLAGVIGGAAAAVQYKREKRGGNGNGR